MAAAPMQMRYARQTVLKEIGESGQRMIGASTVVVIGLGALGSNSANLLARAGVGALRLVDRDVVDWTNLQRQSLFDEEDAAHSLPKSEAAARRLKQVNSSISYEAVTDDINAGNVERIVAGATVVIDGLDNFYTRALVNQACVKHAIPWIYGACLGTFGNAATVIPGVSACLNCLLPEVAQATTPPLSCETVGVFGPIAAWIAAWQSAEAIKIIVGKTDAASTCLVHFDLWNNDFSALPMARDAECAVCGQRKFDLLGIVWRQLRFAGAMRFRWCRPRRSAWISTCFARPSAASSLSRRTPFSSNSAPTAMTSWCFTMAARWFSAFRTPR